MPQMPIIPTQPGGPPAPYPVQDQKLTAGILPAAQNLYNQGGQQPYPFNRRSWFNPLEEQGFDMSLQGGQQGVVDAYGLRPELADFYRGAMGSMSNMMAGGGMPQQNPYATAAISAGTDRMTQDILRNVMPRTDLAAVGAGQAGSSRHGVLQSNVAATGQDAAARAASEAQSRDYNAWLQAQGAHQANIARAWGLAPGMASGFSSMWQEPNRMAVGLGGLMSGQGGQYRELQDQFLGDSMDQWNERQQQPYENLDFYNKMVTGVPAAGGRTTTETPGSNLYADIFGGAALGYGLFDQLGGGGGGGNYDPNFYNAPGNPWGPGGQNSPI